MKGFKEYTNEAKVDHLNESKKIMTAPADGLSAHDWVDVLGIPGFADIYPERSLLTPTSFVMKIVGKDRWPVLCVWKGDVTKEEIKSAVDAYVLLFLLL